MRYISTRGGGGALSFDEAVMAGLARDGGLFLPAEIPDVRACLPAWRGLSYQALAVEVMARFVDLPRPELADLVARSYAGFAAPDVTPVREVGDFHLLELFHGPTLAFKDVALQFLGNLFDRLLARTGGRLNILGATSGDTGSAAIHGARGRRNLSIFILHPRGRTSAVQARQMTSVLDPNVFNLAVEGTFDDCQRIVKTLFGDLPFRDAHALGAVNSVNWARVLAQVVYYFHAGLRVMDRTGAAAVSFSVPTGNFGDIFAGYVAKRMGAPISRLVLATNENDILARFFATGVYAKGAVQQTTSPSMDIQVASNFERYLYYRLGCDGAAVSALMADFATTGRLSVPGTDPDIAAGRGTTAETADAIRRYYRGHGYLLDPHTAVGVAVAERHLRPDEPMICLATAHPAKFPAAIRDALGEDVARHPLIDGLMELPTRCTVVPATAAAVQTYLRQNLD